MFKKLLLLTLTLPFSQSGITATIINEEVFGDFHGGQLFSLVNGENIFIGSQTWEAADKVDGFRFIVPSNSQAIISFEHSFSNLGVNEEMAWIWNLGILSEAIDCLPADDYDCINYSLYPWLAAEVFTSTSGFPATPEWEWLSINGFLLTAGTYELFDNYGFSTNGIGTFSYSINFNVAPIPIPTASWLFISALLSLVGVKRKR